MVNGVATTLYAVIQAIVDALPSVPEFSLEMEFPLSLFDGFSRAYLLCNLIPPAVTSNSSSVLANSPWTLLLTSFVRILNSYLITHFLSSFFIVSDHCEWRFLLDQSPFFHEPYANCDTDSSRTSSVRLDHCRFVVCTSYHWLIRPPYPCSTFLG
jgi:hypothetical protein